MPDMVMLTLGVVVLFALVMGRISIRRHEHDPHLMPFQTGHFGGYGEAPVPCHHRLGSRNP